MTCLRRADKAGNRDSFIVGGTLEQLLCCVTPEKTIGAGTDFSISRGKEFFLAVLNKTNGNLGTAQGTAQRKGGAGRAFRPVCLHEF